MLSRRTAPRLHAVPAPRTPLRRTLPALVLGAAALALGVPTALPAAAAPGSGHLTAAARKAGLEEGNATMGWHERGAQRALTSAPRSGLLPDGAAAAARSSTTTSTPAGVLGIDVSSYQGAVTWSTWTGSNRNFAYIKATEGSTYRSPSFTAQYRGAKQAGLIRGAYHFANPSGKAGYLQARYFVRHGGGWSPDGQTLPGVLDIEYNPYGKTCYGLSRASMVAWVASFTTEYKRLTGKDAVIYSTTDWWRQCTGDSSRFAATNPLWIARYGTKEPGILPKGWAVTTFWQYSSNPIDQDVFPSTLDRLRVLATQK